MAAAPPGAQHVPGASSTTGALVTVKFRRYVSCRSCRCTCNGRKGFSCVFGAEDAARRAAAAAAAELLRRLPSAPLVTSIGYQHDCAAASGAGAGKGAVACRARCSQPLGRRAAWIPLPVRFAIQPVCKQQRAASHGDRCWQRRRQPTARGNISGSELPGVEGHVAGLPAAAV